MDHDHPKTLASRDPAKPGRGRPKVRNRWSAAWPNGETDRRESHPEFRKRRGCPRQRDPSSTRWPSRIRDWVTSRKTIGPKVGPRSNELLLDRTKSARQFQRRRISDQRESGVRIEPAAARQSRKIEDEIADAQARMTSIFRQLSNGIAVEIRIRLGFKRLGPCFFAPVPLKYRGSLVN